MLPLTQAEGSGVEADLRVQDPCFDLLGAGVPGPRSRCSDLEKGSAVQPRAPSRTGG
jgi:hypothetical protein